MGIHCEINLSKPPNGAFFPGNTITGIVKYAVDQETAFTKITVSLKGSGYVTVKDKPRARKNRIARFRNSEDYVDIDHFITEDEKGCTLPIGCYETPFSFKLPDDLPPSISYFKTTARYIVRCNIQYYIRIKFNRPGFMIFPKRFRKDITVITGIRPKFSMEPVIYGEEKKIFQLFSNKKNIVSIKCTIEKSVLSPGSKLKFNYEVTNDSNLNITGVETNLLEVDTFITNGHHDVKLFNDIKDSDTKTASIQSGETQNMDIEITVPSDLGSIENCKFMKRDFLVNLNVGLPFPHRDAVLQIPIQIGEIREEIIDEVSEPPPSYWEAMNEENEEEKKEEQEEKEEEN